MECLDRVLGTLVGHASGLAQQDRVVETGLSDDRDVLVSPRGARLTCALLVRVQRTHHGGGVAVAEQPRHVASNEQCCAVLLEDSDALSQILVLHQIRAHAPFPSDVCSLERWSLDACDWSSFARTAPPSRGRLPERQVLGIAGMRAPSNGLAEQLPEGVDELGPEERQMLIDMARGLIRQARWEQKLVVALREATERLSHERDTEDHEQEPGTEAGGAQST